MLSLIFFLIAIWPISSLIIVPSKSTKRGIELFKLLGENVIRSFSNKKYSPYLIMYSINNEYLGNVRLLNKGWYISLEYDNSVLTKINNNKIVNSMEVYFKRLPNKSYPIIKTHEYNK